MQRINVTIASETPYIMDAFATPEVLSPAHKGNTRRKELDDPREQCKDKVYLSSNHTTLIIPSSNMWNCLIAAGKFQKIGRRTLTTRDSSILPGIFILETFEIPLTDKKGKLLGPDSFEVDSRPVTNQTTGAKVLCHRPRINNWQATFSLLYDDKELSEPIVRQLIDDAGQRIGIGVMRRERKGLFGGFKVVQWQQEQ